MITIEISQIVPNMIKAIMRYNIRFILKNISKVSVKIFEIF
jgi:hypothetical protein